MIISLALLLFVTATGTLATYLYDDRVTFAARLCAGVCVGLTSLGLVAFAFASFIGLTSFSIALSLLVISAPLLLLRNSRLRKFVLQDLDATYGTVVKAIRHPTGKQLGYAAFYLLIAGVLWRCFQRAMIESPEGISTGVVNNFGDLPFHLSVITSFAFGNNFLPEDPTYAGVRFTYPFLSDFISAIFVRCGASLRQSMFIENFVVALAFVGLVHRWAFEMLRDRLAAILTPLLVLLNGGLGWVVLWTTWKNQGSFLEYLKSLPSSFTIIPDTTWRWGNAMSTLLIPQRGFLLGLPLAVIVFTQWWLAMDEAREGDNERENRGAVEQKKRRKGKKKKGKLKSESTSTFAPFPYSTVSLSVRRMIAAGIVAGLLPLVHAHSFVVVMVVGGCIALALTWRAWLPVIGSLIVVKVAIDLIPALALSQLTGKFFLGAIAVSLAIGLWFLLPLPRRRLWYTFFATALIIALPQMWWSTNSSAVDASTFFAFEFGWDSARERYFDLKLAGYAFLQAMPRLRTILERAPDVFWFWLKNAGLFIPITIIAIFWRDQKGYVAPRRVLMFLLPFTLCFIIPNVIRLAPWIWDNIKVLFYWWLGTAPIVALFLARLWQQRALKRIVAVVLFFCLTGAGALDVAVILARPTRHQVFDASGIQFADLIKEKTDPQARIIHAPVHNHPVFLTGRRSLMGYPGHIWTHGLDYVQRESEIKRVYAGAGDANPILKKYGIEYAVVGPHERNLMNVNEQFFSRFERVGEVDGYHLYKITQ